MTDIYRKRIAATLSFLILAAPALVRGAGLVPDCGAACGFSELMVMVNKVVRFLFLDVAVPLAALGFMWAGASLVLSQNKESAWTDAKGRFETIGMGFGIMLGTYVLVKVVIYQFLNTNKGFYTFLTQ